MQAHNYTDTASTLLATTNMATYSLQDGHVGVQMSAWHGSVLPVDILFANLIARRSVSSTFCCICRSLSCGEQKVVRIQQSVDDTDRHAMRLASSMSIGKTKPCHADICTPTRPSWREYVAILVVVTAVSLSVVRPPGTVCHLHCTRQ